MSSISFPEHVRDTFAVMRTGAEAGRLAHGYILACETALDGERLSILLLQWLMCREAGKPCGMCRPCMQVAARTHPDIVWVEPESKSRVIKIEQVRDLNHAVSQKSYEGGWKAGVLLHADRLNENAANAFLKTLEEPPPRSIFLLVTENAQELLPTIVSRCQRVQVGARLGGAEASRVEEAMLEWLSGRGRSQVVEQSAWISAILAEVRTRAEDEEKKKAADSGQEVDKDMLNARIQSRAIEVRMEILRILYRWERDVMVAGLCGDAGHVHYRSYGEALLKQAEGWSAAELMDRVRRVEEASRMLERNVPEPAVWESLLPS